MSDTKERILEAAEKLFAEHGFAGTSLRTVTGEAGVNLAAVHYHFGTKEALLKAVFARRIDPVNQRRTGLLEQLEATAGAEAAPRVEEILQAFLAPVMELKHDLAGRGAVWSRFIGRVYSEPLDIVEPLLRDQFADIGRRFVGILSRALPHLSRGEIYERLQFAVGVMSHTLTVSDQISVLPEYRAAPLEPRETLHHMVTFLAAAFRAPAVNGAASGAASPSKGTVIS